jgi:hypothetical protein
MTTTSPPPQLSDLEHRSQLWPSLPIDLPRYLAWLSKPAMPLIDRLGPSVRRRGARGFVPDDVLLPPGYVAEVVATGLNAPVMTTFGPDGAGYVVESGHKVDEPPRIRRLDLETGSLTIIHEVAADDWVETGALTGATFIDGVLIATNTDRLVRVDGDGTRTLVSSGRTTRPTAGSGTTLTSTTCPRGTSSSLAATTRTGTSSVTSPAASARARSCPSGPRPPPAR